ncbi:MAG: bifunctional DNA-formamidopyrimidine glycosylase/DNA-(apurinic or apyrimidinic site) lyase [Lentisphaeria bacterium]|nr:bifunctional DNA-formamidopyrimidine glycosylase/DNA-(apurinic or apyrimidinic site) lyase [Lentisphaeria bacterium]
MPELPEAETIGRALEKVLCGRKICAVEVFTPAMRSALTPLEHAGLPGRRIVSVRRRGRYLTAALDDNRGLLMHFGMSGVVRVESGDVPRRKHEHVFIHLDDGNIFRFECTRRFSLLEVHELTATGFPAVLDQLGVEPLSGDFTGEYLANAFSRRKIPVKVALMDNAIVCGIGNIYATEALFVAGIDPRRAAGEVSAAECRRIVAEAVRILQEAIICGGTTISDFKSVDGSEGKFVQKLQIYGKRGEVCPRCGEIIDSCQLGGRTSAFCPGCQK